MVPRTAPAAVHFARSSRLFTPSASRPSSSPSSGRPLGPQDGVQTSSGRVKVGTGTHVFLARSLPPLPPARAPLLLCLALLLASCCSPAQGLDASYALASSSAGSTSSSGGRRHLFGSTLGRDIAAYEDDSQQQEAPATERSGYSLIRSELRPPLPASLESEAKTSTRAPGATTVSSELRARLIVIGEASDHSACVLLELYPTRNTNALTGEPIYLSTKDSGAQIYGTPKEIVQNSSSIRLLDGKPVVYCFENLRPATKYTVWLNSAIATLSTLSKDPSFTTLRSKSDLASSDETIRLGFTGGNRYLKVNYSSSSADEDPWAGLPDELHNLDLLVHLGNSVLQDDTSQLWRRSVTGEGLSDEEDEQVLKQCMWCQAQLLLEGSNTIQQWNKFRAQIEELFRSTYRQTWGEASMASILTSVPNIFLMDQHEVRSNWGAEEMDTTIGSRTRWLAKVAFSVAWEYEYALLLDTGFKPSFSSRYETQLGEVGILRLETRFANLDDNFNDTAGVALVEAESEFSSDSQAVQEAPLSHRPGHHSSSGSSELLLGESQWAWLRSVLAENGALHESKELVVMMAVPLVFVGSSTDQVLQKQHDEFLSLWDNYPEEQATLLTLLKSWKGNGTDRQVTIVAGDVALGGHFSIAFDGKQELTQLVVGPTGPWQYDPEMLKLGKKLGGVRVNVTDSISFVMEHEVMISNFGVLRFGGGSKVPTQELFVSAGHGSTRVESEKTSSSETHVQSMVMYDLGKEADRIKILLLLGTVIVLLVTESWHRWTGMVWGVVGVLLWTAFYWILRNLGLKSFLHPGEVHKCYPSWAEEVDGTFNANATCPFGTVIFPGVTMPDELGFVEVAAVSYSLLPVVIGVALLARLLISFKTYKAFETKVTSLCLLFFGVLLQLHHYIQGFQLVEAQRPHLSCNVTCGMPSGHSVLAVGMLTYLTLDAWHRIWPRSVKLECGPLAFATAASEWPFLEGDVITGSTFLMKVICWSLLLLPIRWSRIELYDHTQLQVDIGSFLGLTLGVLWFFLVHMWIVTNHWRLGGRAFGLLHHNHAAPHFRMRALAVSAVVENYPGGKDEILRGLKDPLKKTQLVASVAAWQHQLELCLKDRAIAKGIRYSRQSWLFEIGSGDAAAAFGKMLLEEAREKMPKEEPPPPPEGAPVSDAAASPEGAAAGAGAGAGAAGAPATAATAAPGPQGRPSVASGQPPAPPAAQARASLASAQPPAPAPAPAPAPV